jgi:hypothetical protein
MDDYPRGPPHAGELHVDLISWMAYFTRTMKEIAGFVGEVDDEANFRDIEEAILMNIEGGEILLFLTSDKLTSIFQIYIGVKKNRCIVTWV